LWVMQSKRSRPASYRSLLIGIALERVCYVVITGGPSHGT
jgi:hypothetical protein